MPAWFLFQLPWGSRVVSGGIKSLTDPRTQWKHQARLSISFYTSAWVRKGAADHGSETLVSGTQSSLWNPQSSQSGLGSQTKYGGLKRHQFVKVPG